MKILVINGDCLQTNTSANLCHLAYLRGLVSCGHSVTLLSADGRDYTLDPAMEIPPQITQHTIYGVSLYEKLSLKTRHAHTSPGPQSETREEKPGVSWKHRTVSAIKSAVLSVYGVHGIYATFARRARRFRSEEQFDYVLSISTPVTSHLLTHNLLKSGHIHAAHWIQIWEDPWYTDAYGFNGKKRIFREEQRLLSFAEKVCYVSPLTLCRQQSLFPESAHKMFWQPLPSYYAQSAPVSGTSGQKYGYFGAYYPATRDLCPFYEAARETGVEVNICGDPFGLLASTSRIHIQPRLPLQALSPIEADTSVLVFLCNRGGGQIPGKIYQYSATDKTILFILDGSEQEQETLKAYFQPFNRYVFCRNTVPDITRAIRQIESGELGGVRNVPLADFAPETIIANILRAGGM